MAESRICSPLGGPDINSLPRRALSGAAHRAGRWGYGGAQDFSVARFGTDRLIGLRLHGRDPMPADVVGITDLL